MLRGRTGDSKGAEDTLYRAAYASDAAGDDRLRVAVYGDLIYYIGAQAEKRDLIQIFRREAEAASERLGGDLESEAALNDDVGWAYEVEGKYEDALQAFAKSEALWEKVRGPESVEAAKELRYLAAIRLGVGQLDEALDDGIRALAMMEKAYGPDHHLEGELWVTLGDGYSAKTEAREAAASYERGLHILEAAGSAAPQRASALSALGFAVLELGDASRAKELEERALAIQETSPPENHSDLLYTLQGLGRALLKLNDVPRALATLERAVNLPVMKDATMATPEVEFDLAKALTAAGRESARARGLVLHARDALRTESSLTPIEQRSLREMETWLAGHP